MKVICIRLLLIVLTVTASQLYSEPEAYEVRLFSICGEDTRTPGSDAPVARAFDTVSYKPICTAYPVPNGYFVTAGHCLSGAYHFDEIEINVPDSECSANPVRAQPQHRYKIIKESVQVRTDLDSFQDFALFRVIPGNMSLFKEAMFFRVSNRKLSKIENTVVTNAGYGIDHRFPGQCLNKNRTLQSSSGTAYHTSSWLMHDLDTHRGNSGSPLYRKENDSYWLYGTHRGGSCPNVATSAVNPGFLHALNHTGGRKHVYVDQTGPEVPSAEKTGSVHLPFQTLENGLKKIQKNGILNITPGNYEEKNIRIPNRPFTLKAPFGSVTIKQSR